MTSFYSAVAKERLGTSPVLHFDNGHCCNIAVLTYTAFLHQRSYCSRKPTYIRELENGIDPKALPTKRLLNGLGCKNYRLCEILYKSGRLLFEPDIYSQSPRTSFIQSPPPFISHIERDKLLVPKVLKVTLKLL